MPFLYCPSPIYDRALTLISVGQLKQISRAIGNELDDQAVLIDSLSAEVDSAHGRMNATIAKIQRFSRYKCLKTRQGVDKMIQ